MAASVQVTEVAIDNLSVIHEGLTMYPFRDMSPIGFPPGMAPSSMGLLKQLRMNIKPISASQMMTIRPVVELKHIDPVTRQTQSWKIQNNKSVSIYTLQPGDTAPFEWNVSLTGFPDELQPLLKTTPAEMVVSIYIVAYPDDGSFPIYRLMNRVVYKVQLAGGSTVPGEPTPPQPSSGGGSDGSGGLVLVLAAALAAALMMSG